MHDRLAVDARQRDDAEVDVAALDRQPDAAVLRQALLGDVEVGHDLDARDDAGDHPRGIVVDVRWSTPSMRKRTRSSPLARARSGCRRRRARPPGR